MDAVEDTEYVSALGGTPVPTSSFNFPSAEAVKTFHEKNAADLDILSVCCTPLGAHLYLNEYIRECGSAADVTKTRFLTVVRRYRQNQDYAQRRKLGEYILGTFFPERDSENNKSDDIFPSFRSIPHRLKNKDKDKDKDKGGDDDGDGGNKRDSEIKTGMGIYPPSPETEHPHPHESNPNPNPNPNPDPVDSGPAQPAPPPMINWKGYVEGDGEGTGSDGGALGLTKAVIDAVREGRSLAAPVATAPATAAGEDNTSATPPSPLSSNAWPVSYFDEADTVVWEYLQDKHKSGFAGSEQLRNYIQYRILSSVPPREDDFSLFRVLGKGGFGLVSGCKHVTTGHLYAMKTMGKARVKRTAAEKLCKNEREVLEKVQSKFIVNLMYAFTSSTQLFLILDLMMGGDLSYHLKIKGHFSAEETRFYAARTLLGLADLHAEGIVYRDLKPENILMDDKGLTRLSDLGLACYVPKGGLLGSCGTRGYWAPEMIAKQSDGKRKKYSFTVDWFSFGCLIYEMATGQCPFRSQRARTYGLDMQSESSRGSFEVEAACIDLAVMEMNPETTADVSPLFATDQGLADICHRLLDKNPATRLGANGPREVISHTWFASLDWSAIYESRANPPFVPDSEANAQSASNIGTFEDEDNSLTEQDHACYDEWNYINPRTFDEEVLRLLLARQAAGLGKSKAKGSSGCNCSMM